MKRLLFAVITAATFSPALAADVGVSVSIGQPGFYGQIDIGHAPLPIPVYREPVVIYRGPATVIRQPLYLYVPPNHSRNWRRYCNEYNACGRPVYFVQERWYNNVYVPYYRDHRDHRGGQYERNDRYERHDRGYDRGHDKGYGRGRRGN